MKEPRFGGAFFCVAIAAVNGCTRAFVGARGDARLRANPPGSHAMRPRLLFVPTALLLAAVVAPVHAGDISCTLHYNMSGGGAFYKHSTGSGEVSCSNGQRLAVDIESKGGGLTFGHSSIVDGVGRFS